MTVFKDVSKNFPVASGILPDGFVSSAKLDMTRISRSKFYRFIGQSEDPQGQIRICFQDGDQFTYPMKMVYSNDPFIPGQRDKNGVMNMTPCSLQEQMMYFVGTVTGQPSQPVSLYGFSAEKQGKISAKAQEMFMQTKSDAQQIAYYTQSPFQINYLQTLLDGGTGTFRLQDGRVCGMSLWRFGVEAAYYPVNGIYPGMMNMYQANYYQPSRTGGFGYSDVSASAGAFASWGVPYIIWSISDEAHLQEMTDILVTFADSFEISAQMDALDKQAQAVSLQEAIQISQQNTAMIQQAMMQQQAAWDAVDRQRAAISQDLDRFHQQTFSNLQANDAWRQQFQQTINPVSSMSDGETMDDRIQRMRHESMMGVNTFTNDEGHEREVTTMADRVFEKQNDPDTYFGTENYYGNVPYGWNELLKKK